MDIKHLQVTACGDDYAETLHHAIGGHEVNYNREDNPHRIPLRIYSTFAFPNARQMLEEFREAPGAFRVFIKLPLHQQREGRRDLRVSARKIKDSTIDRIAGIFEETDKISLQFRNPAYNARTEPGKEWTNRFTLKFWNYDSKVVCRHMFGPKWYLPFVQHDPEAKRLADLPEKRLLYGSMDIVGLQTSKYIDGSGKVIGRAHRGKIHSGF